MVSKNSEASTAGTGEASIVSATCEKLTMTSIATQISTINVPFHGDNLYLVSFNGEPHVPMKPIVEGMGLAWQPQHEKLKTRFSKGITEIVIPTKGGDQSMTCLAFRKFAGWLHTINIGKVRHELRDKVARYQEECDDVLYQYWMKGEAVNPRKKTTVDQRTPLRDAVNMLVGKKGLRYDDAYNMVHQRFAIDSIDELELEQIPLAVEYVHRMALEGEFIAKADADSKPVKIKEDVRYRVRVLIYDTLFGGCVEMLGVGDTFQSIASGISTDLGYRPNDVSWVGMNKAKLKRVC
ncbi:TPA: phage antirepressor N-terminal domain-containing protein [Serratia marcescens]|nr:phage antirepressor N-terminal domain-containing protein [Serratia marcescens]